MRTLWLRRLKWLRKENVSLEWHPPGPTILNNYRHFGCSSRGLLSVTDMSLSRDSPGEVVWSTDTFDSATMTSTTGISTRSVHSTNSGSVFEKKIIRSVTPPPFVRRTQRSLLASFINTVVSPETHGRSWRSEVTQAPRRHTFCWMFYFRRSLSHKSLTDIRAGVLTTDAYSRCDEAAKDRNVEG